MTRTRKLLLGLAGGLALLAAGLVLAVALFDWNTLKPYVNQRVSAALGRPFAIKGELAVDWQRLAGLSGWRGWVPWPHVRLADVSLGNALWARSPTLATLERVEFSLSPLPLLSRRIVIRRIQLTRPAADLQRRADGHANWIFELPETREPSPWMLDIDEIGFDQGHVIFVDETLKANLEVLIDPLGKPIPYAAIAGAAADSGPPPRAGSAPTVQAAAPPDYMFGWKVQGRYKGLPLRGQGKVGGMLALRDTAQPFPLQADVHIGATRAAVTGTLTDPLNLAALNLRLVLAGATMSDLYPLIGVTLPDTPPYATDGRLRAQLRDPAGATFRYQNFNGSVGKSDLYGDITFAMQVPRPKLSGKLSSRLLRMRDLGPLVGVQPGAAANAADAKAGEPQGKRRPAQPRDKVLPIQVFRTDRWRVMDADVALAAERILYDEKLPLTGLAVHLVLNNGQLALEPLRFGMAGGSIHAVIHLDGGKTPMAGRIRLSARQLRLKQLFPTVKSMQRALGALNGDAALSGSGNSVAALLGSASGEVKLLVNDGVISRALMEIAGLNVGNYVVSKLFGDDEVRINCGAADLEMKRGLMNTRLFVFDTENALVQISGTASFKDETLDLDISPKSKGMRMFSLRSPLYVKGTFKNPDAGVQVLPLAARGAGVVALGVLLTPAAGLLALIAPSAGEAENPCTTLFKPVQGSPKAPSSKASGTRPQ